MVPPVSANAAEPALNRAETAVASTVRPSPSPETLKLPSSRPMLPRSMDPVPARPEVEVTENPPLLVRLTVPPSPDRDTVAPPRVSVVRPLLIVTLRPVLPATIA